MSLASISKNFIVLEDTKTLREVVDILLKNSPEYLVLSSIEGNEHFHYLYLKEMVIEDFQEKANGDEGEKSIKEVFDLHEWGPAYTHNSDVPVNDESDLGDIASRSQRGGAVVVENGVVTGIVSVLLSKGGNASVETKGGEGRTRGGEGRGIDEIDGSSEPTFVKRYPVGELPEKMTLNQTAVFKVSLDSKRTQSSGSGMSVPLDKEITVIAETVPSGHVEFVDGNVRKMKVMQANSNPVIFELKPIKKGTCVVKAQFYYQGNYLGDVGVKTTISVNPTSSEPVRKTSSIEINTDSVGPDLTLIILEEDSSIKYKIIGIAQRIGYPLEEFSSIQFRGDPEQQFRTIFEDLEEEDSSDEVSEDKIASKGRTLFSELFPRDLQKFYWKHKDNIKTIQIISQEPWIPWEIVKPWTNNNGNPEEEDFFCAKHAFTRWIKGINTKQKKSINSIKVVIPKDTNLDAAKEEFKWIKEFARNTAEIPVTRDSSYEEVLKSLKEGGFDLLHFTTHGAYEKKYANMSRVKLEGEDNYLTAENISGMLTKFGQNKPLIIMNACQTGNTGFALTGIGGWVRAFLQAGSFGFIGTLWSVGDDTAMNFTKNLFSKLHANMPLDEAVKEARYKARQQGDTSWLSYTVYAPSNTSIKIGK